MRFEKEIGGGRAFMEFKRQGNRFVLKSRGFIGRYKGGMTPCQPQQATESPLIHDGSQTVLSTAQDARNSTLTGSTLNGPSGSGQFLAMVLTGARTVSIASSTAGASFGTQPFYGILQNKPRGGEAADVGIFGITKVIAGSTSIVAGSVLMMSTTLAGMVNIWSSGAGPKIGVALEAPTSTGMVITAAIGSFGNQGSS